MMRKILLLQSCFYHTIECNNSRYTIVCCLLFLLSFHLSHALARWCAFVSRGVRIATGPCPVVVNVVETRSSGDDDCKSSPLCIYHIVLDVVRRPRPFRPPQLHLHYVCSIMISRLLVGESPKTVCSGKLSHR